LHEKPQIQTDQSSMVEPIFKLTCQYATSFLSM
jgi:hypothetical protein